MTSRDRGPGNSPVLPFSIKGIDHLLLLVEGMERAEAFYRDVLGCRVENRLPQYAMAELAAGASRVDLVDVAVPEGQWARPAVPGGRNLDHFCLSVEGVGEAALRAHLELHGAAVIEERREAGAAGSTLSLYLCDPCGNVVELLLRV